MPLAHRVQRVQGAAIEQTEVAGVVLQLNLGERPEELVEPLGRLQLER